MNAPLRERKSHIWAPHPEEWFVEPPWVSSRLFDVEDFTGGLLDPACGRGNILDSADAHDLPALGYDIKARCANVVFDFLSSDFPIEVAMPIVGEVRHIASNPPFDLCRPFALKALSIVGDGCKVAMIFPTRRLNAAGAWLRRTPLKRVLYLTPRPSMPPGEVYEALLAEGKKPSGGKQDFCWLVWQRGWMPTPTVEWLHRDKGARS